MEIKGHLLPQLDFSVFIEDGHLVKKDDDVEDLIIH